MRATRSTSGAALVIAACMAAYPVIGIAPSWRPLVALGVIGLAGLVLAMVLAWPQAVGWSLSALILQYGVSMIGQAAVDAAVVLYVAALVVVAELALSVIAQRPINAHQKRLSRRDLGRIGALAIGGAFIAAIVLIATAPASPDWRWLPAIALGAAASALAVLTTLARSTG